MNYATLAQTFEQIEQESSRLAITALLADLLQQATPHEAMIIANLSLGLLRPSYQGSQFNFGEKNCIVVLADLLNMSEQDVAHAIKQAGDIGSFVQQASWPHTTGTTLEEVYQALIKLETISGNGAQEQKGMVLKVLLQSVDPISAKYVLRVLLGTLRLGFSDMTLIDALSWMVTGDKSLRNDLEHAYNICADLGLIAQTLKQEGIEAIRTMKIRVGVPIRPAAAERLPSAREVFEKLGVCIAQPKLDGFRLQIHVDNTGDKPVIKFFSRNLIDMSAMFPDIVQALEGLKVDSLICEGEAIVFDEQTNSYMPFQETVKRKRKHGIDQAVAEYPLHVYLFDLLYSNGQECLSLGHEQRREMLLKIFEPLRDSVIHVLDEQVIHSAEQLEAYFAYNITAGLEGLVVKRPDAVYQPGKRNFNWIKLKRHQEGHLEDTLDCVILGYYAGTGKRSHFGIGAFLVGVYNKERDIFQTIAKIGTGMTDQEWKELKQECDRIKAPEQPHNVVCAKELYPDVWVYPELVCTIFADEITQSPLHTAGKTNDVLGYALRFPRIIGMRPDKDAPQVTSVDEVKRIYEDQYRKK